MAQTFREYNAPATYSFTFPSYQSSDVKVRVDGVLQTAGTHYNITGYSTTGGGTVAFIDNSGSGGTNHTPSSGVVRIYRDTNVDTAKATFTAGSSVKAADLNNNNTQLLYRAQEEQIPNLIHSYDIDDGAITSAKFATGSVTSDKIADDQINSQHYVDGSIDTAHIADGNITHAKIQDNAVITTKIADGNVTSAKIATGNVTTAKIADSNVTTAKIADSNVTTAKIADNNITGAKIANDQIDSRHYAAGSIDQEHFGSEVVGTAAIEALAVTTAKIQDNAVTTGKIADDAVTTAKIAAGAVSNSEIANGAVRAAQIHDGEVTTVKLANDAVTTAKIANNAVTTDKIADSELSTLAGMQSATASKLADSTALTADIADLNQIDGMAKQTTITDDDTKFPTSGAVVDYVAAQLEPFGGFEAIANESSFPNTQPASGVAISIADAGGMAVSGSGTASGATVGGTTVNISGIASNFHGSTVAAGIRFIVTSTGSGQNYTYHKATLKEDDLINLSGDINDFSERYRVGSSNPTSSLDSGDLFFNTGTGKLLVYNGTNAAWEEAQSVGNFFINTISSSSATGGGSATPNGTAYRFTLSNAGTNAEQHIVSVDGVIQKPNSGSSQPSEGFAVSGADIIFGSAPVSGASIFVITIGSTVNIGTPSNNTVTTAILQNGSVTTAKIVDDAVTTAKIANLNVTATKIADNTVNSRILADTCVATGHIIDANVTTAKIADDAVTAAKLANTSVSAGSYGSSTSIPSITVDAQGRITAASGNTVNTDLVGDTSPQLGGTLDTNGQLISFGDSSGATNNRLTFGAGTDLTIHHDGTDSRIAALAGSQKLKLGGSIVEIHNKANSEVMAKFTENGAVELYHDNSKKFETTSSGGTLYGDWLADANFLLADSDRIKLGNSADFQIYHDGSNSVLSNATGTLYYLAGTQQIMNLGGTETMAKFIGDGAVELYYDNNKVFETIAAGIKVQRLTATSSYIEIATSGGVAGYLYGQGNNEIHLMDREGHQFFKGIKDGASELFYDNSKKLETTTHGIKLGGASTVADTSADDLQIGLGTGHHGMTIYSGTSHVGAIYFADGNSGDQRYRGYWQYEHNYDRFVWGTTGVTRLVLNSNGHLLPGATNSYDLGESGTRWRNIYTNDLHLSNEGHSNDVDGTWGDWTIQEGESDLFLKNNRSGKKYKFNLTEVS